MRFDRAKTSRRSDWSEKDGPAILLEEWLELVRRDPEIQLGGYTEEDEVTDGDLGERTMGYEVHITRRSDWSDEDGPGISLEEWLQFVRGDPEMRLDGYAEAQHSEGGILRVEDPSLCVWTGHPRHGQEAGLAWFYHSDGNIVVKNPDEAILRKMWQIAQDLVARVQGDDGELYGPDGKMMPEALAGSEASRKERPWWRFW